MEPVEKGCNNVSLLGCSAYACFWPCCILNSGDLCFSGRKPRKGRLSGLMLNLSCFLLNPDALPCQLGLPVCRRGDSGARERENLRFCEELSI